MACYNLERIPPAPKPPFWYQCMYCKASNYQEGRVLSAPSSNVCKKELCRLEFILSFADDEKRFEEYYKKMIKNSD